MGIQIVDIFPIAEFLQNKKLLILHFQRPYKWAVKNVIQLSTALKISHLIVLLRKLSFGTRKAIF